MTEIKPSRSLYIALLRLADITLPVVVLYVATHAMSVGWGERYLALALVAGLMNSLANQVFGAYDHWRGRSFAESVLIAGKAWCAVLLVLLVMFFFLKLSTDYSRVVVGLWSLSVLLLQMVERYALKALLRHMYRKGVNVRKIAFAGGGKVGFRLAEVFEKHPCLGYRVVGLYDDHAGCQGEIPDGVPYLGDACQLCLDAEKGLFDELYLAFPITGGGAVADILERLHGTSVVVKYVPDLFALGLLYAKWSDFKGVPVISIYDTPMSSNMTRALKRAEDLILSGLILLLIWPVMLLIALGVKLSSPGPVFYRQVRIGWNGRPFTMLKFRSMPVDLESAGVEWGKSNAKKKTPFGQFIRSTSLDELPQFINVFLGDMSIVGPRPERDIFIEKISSEVPKYMQRHMVKAGITGLAQVNGWRGDTCLKKRVEMDLQYITNWSVWLDLKIIILSTFKGWVHKNAY